MNMYLIIIEGKYGARDVDDSSCNGYYIIKISSSSYNLQADLNIYGQVISSGEKVCVCFNRSPGKSVWPNIGVVFLRLSQWLLNP